MNKLIVATLIAASFGCQQKPKSLRELPGAVAKLHRAIDAGVAQHI